MGKCQCGCDVPDDCVAQIVAQARSADLEKTGFREFSGPPRWFRRYTEHAAKTRSGGAASSTTTHPSAYCDCLGGGWSATAHSSYTLTSVYDPAANQSTRTVTGSGTWSYRIDGTTCSRNEYIPSIDGGCSSWEYASTDSGGSMTAALSVPVTAPGANKGEGGIYWNYSVPIYSALDSTGASCFGAPSSSTAESITLSDPSGTTCTKTLSAEYTTADLTADAIAKMEAKEWADGAAMAGKELTGAGDKQITVSAARYKIRVKVPGTCKIKVTWEEQFTPSGASAPTIRTAKEHVFSWSGTKAVPCWHHVPDYDPADQTTWPVEPSGEDEWFVLAPPAEEGTWEVGNVVAVCTR